ncbi:MAG: hypothetical protein WC588_02665 [Candidatus Micrarchaeia archaeon]
MGFVLNTIPQWLGEKKWSILGWAIALFFLFGIRTISSAPADASMIALVLGVFFGTLLFSLGFHAAGEIPKSINRFLNKNPIKKDESEKLPPVMKKLN